MTSMGYMQEQDVIIEGLMARIGQLEEENKVLRDSMHVIANVSPSAITVQGVRQFARTKLGILQ